MQKSAKELKALLKKLDEIIDFCNEAKNSFPEETESVHPDFSKSVVNLLHYLAFRNYDIRDMQKQLAELSLSSLGRSEAHIMSSLIGVRNHISQQLDGSELGHEIDFISTEEGDNLLEVNTENLLGKPKEKRRVRIMVTLSKDAADNYSLIKDLVLAGMDCARINCAHDSHEDWVKITDNIHRAEKETGKSCKILMDLAGIKIRTGPLKPGPQLMRIKAKRDFFGKLKNPAKIWLGSHISPLPAGVKFSIPVNPEWIQQLEPGDKIHFKDKRGKKRRFRVISMENHGCIAELYKRSFIEAGTELYLKQKKKNIPPTYVGELPSKDKKLLLKIDDILIVHKALVPGEDAKSNEDGLVIEPAHISCSADTVFDKVKEGEPIIFNDGKIEGKIISVSDGFFVVKITQAKPKGNKLGKDKGINLPETDLGISGLTEKDLTDLRFVAHHADIVNLSFVNHPEDIFALQQALINLEAPQIGIMLKIETQKGFKNLPMLLLAAMKNYPVGVMIARGDLAVECGWQRLAEIQEEILWICEAAHIPVVWATQVLESLAKKGSPSRAEITDAAMSQRAECVMLNKGPHILEAIKMLSDILGRMEDHQHKKTSMLRILKMTEVFNKD